MDATAFAQVSAQWQQELTELDRPLRDWGQQKPDFSDPNWMQKMQQTPLKSDPVLRQRFDTLARAMAQAYLQGSPEQCENIRALIRQHRGVQSFLGIPAERIAARTDSDFLLLGLTYLSMIDLGKDTRDAIVSLDELLKAAKKAGIDPVPFLRQVAAVSGDANHHGMGSMKAILTSRLQALAGRG